MRKQENGVVSLERLSLAIASVYRREQFMRVVQRQTLISVLIRD
jgi:hypothetical protein